MEKLDPATIRLFSAIVLAKAKACTREELLDMILLWPPVEAAARALAFR